MKAMEWISIKDRLSDDQELVLIQLNYQEQPRFVAKFFDNLSTCDGDYENIFILMVHPKFPKECLFNERYRKISKIPKNKVTHWMPLPKPPKHTT